MSNWRVLVVDDEANGNDGRSATYRLLENISFEGRPINITFAKNMTNAMDELRSRHFDLALIDVVLKKWGDTNGHGFMQLLSSVPTDKPVALLSSLWDAASIGFATQALTEHPERDVHLFLRWADLEKDGTRNIVALQLQREIYRQKDLLPLATSDDQKLRILHLSDLHFGSGKSTISGPELRRIAQKIKDEWPDGPHLIAVTGDIANTGHPDEYSEAFDWFQKLGKELGWSLPSRRFLVVPGNHDHNVSIGASGTLKIGPNGKFKHQSKIDESGYKLAEFAMSPFQKFAMRLTGQNDQWAMAPLRCWVEASYRHYGVVFSGFNTSRYLGENGWPVRRIDTDEFAIVEDQISAIRKEQPNVMHVSLSHHSPVAYETEQPIDNAFEFRRHLVNTAAFPQLILHGHGHSREVFPYLANTLVISAPTPSAHKEDRPPDNARGFTMIELGRSNSSVSDVTVFSYILDAARWIRVDQGRYDYDLATGFRKTHTK